MPKVLSSLTRVWTVFELLDVSPASATATATATTDRSRQCETVCALRTFEAHAADFAYQLVDLLEVLGDAERRSSSTRKNCGSGHGWAGTLDTHSRVSGSPRQSQGSRRGRGRALCTLFAVAALSGRSIPLTFAHLLENKTDRVVFRPELHTELKAV
jgi:hypothetical protein